MSVRLQILRVDFFATSRSPPSLAESAFGFLGPFRKTSEVDIQRVVFSSSTEGMPPWPPVPRPPPPLHGSLVVI